ncbi:MAG TPA: hypothetical protein DCE07_07080 [Peptococcaceae bacterium]|nr:hypothetical protein [Peptococcaceae bacterium]
MHTRGKILFQQEPPGRPSVQAPTGLAPSPARFEEKLHLLFPFTGLIKKYFEVIVASYPRDVNSSIHLKA